MAKDEKTAKNKKSKGDKKRLDISAIAVIDNMVFNKTERWAYYRLSNSVYDFLSTNARIAVAQQLINAFVNLMNDRQEPLDCHLIIASTPVDVDSWESQIVKLSEDWDRGPGFDQYLEEQANYLRAEEYLKKVTYLGVNMGKRGALELDTNALEAGIKGASEQIKNWLNSALQLPGEEITLKEENEARKKEDELYRVLSVGNLKAERCTAEELLLLIKRQFYPAMAVPYLDVDHDNRIGPGDLDIELSSSIRRNFRNLAISQMLDDQEVECYRAALSITRLPRQVNFPYSSFPFLYYTHKIGLPFTSYARFTLHPTQKMKKELEKKKKEMKDEQENLQAGTGTLDSSLGVLPTDVTEAFEDMRTLTEMLSSGKTPWVEGTYRVVVETPDEKMLKKYCSLVKQRYTDLDIQINWTVGDQLDLFLEQMPGDRLRGDSHKQITNLTMLGTSGFNFSSDVGDLVFDGNGSE